MSDKEASERKTWQNLYVGGKQRAIARSSPFSKSLPYDFTGINRAHKYGVSKYLEVGWQLVPVDSQTNEVALPNGVAGASDDLDTVNTWAEMPGISLGVATGQGSGILGLRFRGPLGALSRRMLEGQEQFVALKASTKEADYYFFAAPEQNVPSRNGVAPGVDVLGEGSFFVLSEGFWRNGSAELATVPSCLFPLVTGEMTLRLHDLVATGDFSAINHASAYEAAQAYAALGWKLHSGNTEGDISEDPVPPEFWRDNPDVGLALATGAESGVVALTIPDPQTKYRLEVTFGRIPFPFVSGTEYVLLFQAPAEQFPFKKLVAGIEYVSEGHALLLPPSTSDGYKLRWEVGRDFSPGLPEMPEWLHTLLTDPKAIAKVVQSQPQEGKQASQKGKEQGSRAELGATALHYAAQGWLVFPLKPGGKTPLVKNWGRAATRDREKISKWWQGKRNANIGVTTGAESGVVVLDVDVKNDQPGQRNLTELEAQHGRIETLRARTPTGGLHLFFLAPRQEVRNRTGFLPGLDFRGQGGYVVVAPSNVGGKEYRWETPSAKIAEMPEWLLSLVTAPSKKVKGTSTAQHERLSYAEALAGVQEGSRNDTIFRFACKLRQEGLEYDEALIFVRTAAGNCQPPLPEDKAILCLDSAWRYAPPFALTDTGNAERFVAQCGDRVRYVQEKERWLVWAGHWWETNSRALYRMAKKTIRSLRDEAEAEDDPKRRKILLSHSRKSESVVAIDSMLALAARELSVRPEDLDRGDLVAFANGVFDLKKGNLRPGRREDLLTKHAPFPYEPSDPKCQQWLELRGAPPRQQPPLTDESKQWLERLDRWLAERCELGEGFSSTSEALRKDFSSWAKAKITPHRFGRLLTQKGITRGKSNSRCYVGLRLRS